MSDRHFYVYAFFRTDGTPCYVGKGKGARWRHDGKYGRNHHLLRIITKAKQAGQPIERIKLAENLSEQEALRLEAFFIAAVGREAHGGPLVNLSDGGETGPVGYKWTEEQRHAHGDKRRGRQHSPEWRRAISAGLKGKPKTPEHNAAAAAGQRGGTKSSGWWSTEEGRAKQKQNNLGNSGHHHTAETRDKIRCASIRQHASESARKAVTTSSAWANLNSVRYNQSATA